MRVGLIAGIGDALNGRAFLINYCRQKDIDPKSIYIFTDRYRGLFSDEGFTFGTNRGEFRGLIGYKNFGNYELPKIYDIPKCDECIAKNAGIDFSFDTVEPLNWNADISHISLPKKFVTINNGYGHLSGNANNPSTICTKSWLHEYWEKLVENIGVPCVQIGNGNSCKPINGVALNLVDKLNLKQSAEVMKRALFHIDVEGGLVILNQHLGGKSVVLFGPTAIENQGRSFNLNIRATDCTPCYEWGTNKYKLKMYLTELPCRAHCMTDIKPEYVIEQIYKNRWLK